MSDGTFEEARAGDRDEVLTGARWPVATQQLTFYPAPRACSRTRRSAGGSVAFPGDPRGFIDPKAATRPSSPRRCSQSDIVIAGVPKLTLSASVTVPRVHLIATLYDGDPEGERAGSASSRSTRSCATGSPTGSSSCPGSATTCSRRASRWRTTCAPATGS